MKNKNCRFIKFKTISKNIRGELCQVQQNDQVPFKIKRIFYILKTPNKTFRGCHAHKKQSQLLICLQGNIKLSVRTSENVRKKYVLKNSSHGLFVPPKTWVDKIFFNQNAILLVIVDGLYKETDYIRNFDEFLKYANIKISKNSKFEKF